MAELPKVDLESKDLVAERIELLMEFFPEIATEGDGYIDFEKLRLILGDSVEDSDERYSFVWPGKKDAIRLSQSTSTATLRPRPEKSVAWSDTENLYIEGDNLEVLKLLQRAYFGKIKMIYIDPPYNTGHDFVYKDRFGDTIANYREQAGLTGQSNPETSGRYHSDWCSMMYPRLRLARELLTEDGVIFISIDDNEQATLVKLCDEVFGEANRIGPLIQNKMNAKNDTVDVQKNHEFILVYRKTARYIGTRELATIENITIREREVFEEDGRYYYLNDPITTRGEGGTLNARPNLGYTVYYNPQTGEKKAVADYDVELARTAKEESEVYHTDQRLLSQGFVPIRPPRVRGKLGCWTWEINKFNQQSDEIVITGRPGSYAVRKRTFVERGKCINRDGRTFYQAETTGNSRSILDYSTNEGTKELNGLMGVSGIFDNPKNVDMLEYFVSLVPGKDFLVMDFFSGSGSSAQAVMRANAKDGGTRRMISVQLPEIYSRDSAAHQAGYKTICDAGEERIRRAGEKTLEIVDESSEQLQFDDSTRNALDIGFRVFTLDESNFNQPKEGQLLIDRIKSGSTDLDIIFEMMLKWGLELTYPIEEDEVNGYPIYSIAYDELICCMQAGLTVNVLEAIAARQPRRVFIIDSVIDDTIKLNALQIFKRVEEHTQQKIDLRTV